MPIIVSLEDAATLQRYKSWALTHDCAISTTAKSVRYLRWLVRERNFDLWNLESAHDSSIEGLAYWRAHGVKSRTLNSWLREINLWARFNGLGWKIAYFRRPPPPHVRVPDEELAVKLLSLTWIDPSANSRNRAILHTLIQLGIRRNELVHLELADLIHDDGRAWLEIRHAKGEKQRTLPISPDLDAELRQYVALYRYASSRTAFFTTTRGPVSYAYVGMILKKAGARVDASWLSPHKLRHFAVDYALDHGMSIGSVAELMGHARWETTQIYRQRRLAKQQMEREFRALPQLVPAKKVKKTTATNAGAAPGRSSQSSDNSPKSWQWRGGSTGNWPLRAKS